LKPAALLLFDFSCDAPFNVRNFYQHSSTVIKVVKSYAGEICLIDILLQKGCGIGANAAAGKEADSPG
jgi:hypothetical protein